MTKENEWEKVEMSPAWNKTNEDGTYSLKENDSLIGIYRGKEENIGDNNSTIYNFKTAEGMMSVWDTTVLAVRLKNIEVGEEVKIIYLGKVPNKTKGRKPYHNFEVFHRKPAFVPVEKIEPEEAKSFQESLEE